MAKLAVIDSYEKIEQFYRDDLEKLDTETIKVLVRVDQADNLIRQYGGGRKTTKMLYLKISGDQPKYSMRQADRDMQFAMALYNATNKTAKEMDKLYAINTLKVEIRRAQRYISNPNQRAQAVTKLFKELRETQGYHMQDPDIPDFSEIGANQIIISTDTTDTLNIKQMSQSERMELERKYELPPDLADRLDAEDVEFEEVDDE